VPVPYTGSIADADIFVLNLNPGFKATDYYAECCIPDFRRQIEANLRQETLSSEFPFLYLDPELCWHSAFTWWESKFRDIAWVLAEKRYGGSYYDGLSHLSKRMAAIELVPYHSVSFLDHVALKRLRSSQLARKFVLENVLPQALVGKAVVVVTFGAKYWDHRPRERSSQKEEQRA
jgi:hypothetical protein